MAHKSPSARKARPKATAQAEAARPRGRGRPCVISTDALLDAAREVFLERGIQATTADVAKRAGVAEGTIFHRFRSKDELFRAAMRVDPDKLPLLLETLPDLAGSGDLRQTLIDFANRMLEIGRVALPVMMMSWSNPASEHALEKMLDRAEPYRRAFQAVCRFFELEMSAGRLARLPTEVLARIFMGSLHHYCLTELFLVNRSISSLSSSAFTEGLVDVLLKAAAYEPKPSLEKPRGYAKLSRL